MASLAWTQLTPATQAKVSRLLAPEPDSSFDSISTWADEFRSPSTASWHYLNFPRDANCRYDAMRSFPGGHCAVAAIQRQLGVLGGPGSDPDRLGALKYLVHLVADVHQPLHAGFADDRGGNQYQVQAFGRGGSPPREPRVQAIGRQPQRAPDGAPVNYKRHRPEQTTLYFLHLIRKLRQCPSAVATIIEFDFIT